MSGFLLTDEESRRFEQWLEKQIFSADEMLKVIDGAGLPAADAMKKKFKTEIAAFSFVLAYLRASEKVSIQANPPPPVP